MILQASEDKGQSLNLIEDIERQDQRLNWEASEADLGGEKMEDGEKLLEIKATKIEERKMEKNESLAVSPSSSWLKSLMTVVERQRRQAFASPSPLPEAEPTEELLVEEPKKGPRWQSIWKFHVLIVMDVMIVV